MARYGMIVTDAIYDDNSNEMKVWALVQVSDGGGKSIYK